MAIVQNVSEHRLPLTLGYIDAGTQRNIDVSGAVEQQYLEDGKLLLIDADTVPPAPEDPYFNSPRDLFLGSGEPALRRSQLWIDRDNLKLYERKADNTTAFVAELGGGGHRIVAGGNLGSAYTLDTDGEKNVWLTGTLNANLVLSLSELSAGAMLTLLLQQDETGGRSLTMSDSTTVPVASEPAATSIVTIYVLAEDNLIIQVAGSAPPAPALLDPTSLNPLFWLDIDQFTGTTDATAIATAVDSSTHAHNAVQATSGARPTKRTVDGRPVLRFLTDDSLVSTRPFQQIENTSLFFVVRRYTPVTYGTLISLADTQNEVRQDASSGKISAIYESGGLAVEASAAPTTTPHVMTLQLPLGAPALLYRDGALIATGNANVAAVAAASLGIGDRAVGGSPGTFDCGDVFWCPIVSSDNRAAMEAYLAAKEAIS